MLGTGLSHDGSAVLVKDGHVCVGIEKERITRQKHDGGNDSAAIDYCLDAAGITLSDVDLVVQTANFEYPGVTVSTGPDRSPAPWIRRWSTSRTTSRTPGARRGRRRSTTARSW